MTIQETPKLPSVILLVALSLTGCERAPASLRDLVEAVGVRYEVPGMAVAVTRAEMATKIVVFGVKHVGLPDPIEQTNRFHLGSNTKAMTATLLAIVVEDNKLGWNTTVLSVFPEWKDDMQSAYHDVTITDLLCHRAGLSSFANLSPEEWDDLVQATSHPGSDKDKRREFAHRVLHRKPAVPPRTQYLYSNSGYAVAAAMAERVTEQSWESLMRTRLFDPLGIRATFEWPAFDDPNQPWGHRETKNGFQPHDPHDEFQEPVCLRPAGGVAICPGDYARFLELHLRGLEGHDGLLKADTIRHLHAPVEGNDYAFGWIVSDFEGAIASRHGGTVGTFDAKVAIWPSRDLAVAVFANAYGKKSDEACTQVLKGAARLFSPVNEWH
jgi:CubicO group peptidase (beta-lactamase class C family)